jgi:hypothetical protein
MRSRRAAIFVLTVLMLSLLGALPAAAGGPTSVLLVAPDTGRTASLYSGNGSGDYETLAELVGAFDADGAGAEDRSGASHDQGAGITLNWLAHDVAVWRVDRVFLDAPGGPWISTQTVDGSGDVWDKPAAWHKAERGGELAALLDRLGVGPRARTQPPASPAAVAAPRQGADAVTRPSPQSTSGVVWGAAGLALGAALTLVGVSASRLVRGRRSRGGSQRLATPYRPGASGRA